MKKKYFHYSSVFMGRHPPQQQNNLSVRRCEVHGCDDDIACDMSGLCPDNVANATCKSLECLAQDVVRGEDLRKALMRNDRHLYAAVAVVAFVVCLAAMRCVLFPNHSFMSRRHPPW